MASPRGAGALTLRLHKDSVVTTHEVLVLLSVDLHFAHVERNPGVAPAGLSLRAWAKLRDTKVVPLLRDGGTVLEWTEGRKVFVVRRGRAKWEFEAGSAEVACAWAKAIGRRVAAWRELLPKIGVGGVGNVRNVDKMWRAAGADAVLQLTSLPDAMEIEKGSERSHVETLVRVLGNVPLEKVKEAVGVFESVLEFSPVVGVAISVMTMAVSMLETAARVRSNRQAVREARSDTEKLAVAVLDELRRLVVGAWADGSGGGVSERRLRVVAQLLGGLEDVVRELDEYELGNALKMAMRSHVPEQLLKQIQEMRAIADKLADNVDVDLIARDVGAILDGNRVMAGQMREVRSKLDKIYEFLDNDGTRATRHPTRGPEDDGQLEEALTNKLVKAIVPQFIDELTERLSPSQLAALKQDGVESVREWRGGILTMPPLSSRIVADVTPGCGTPEAFMKEKLLEQDKRNIAATSRNHRTVPIGVKGGAGTGKTAALIVVANDEDVRACFGDNIFFLRLSHLFTVDGRDIVLAWAKLVRAALGVEAADKIRGMNSVDAAMEAMIDIWSKHPRARHSLFIVDNVWATESPSENQAVREEWLWRMRKIAGTEGSVLFSTRDDAVTFGGGYETLRIEPIHPPRSDRAVRLFNSWLEMDSSDNRYNKEITEKLLGICAGLPLCISIAASSARNCDYDWELVDLQFTSGRFVDVPDPDPENRLQLPTLRTIVSASLEVLKDRKAGSVDGAVYVARYYDLSIFKYRSRLPLSTLAILWKCDRLEAHLTCAVLSRLGLVTNNTRKHRIEIHDSLVLFLRSQIIGAGGDRGKLTELHRKFLRNIAHARGIFRNVEEIRKPKAIDSQHAALMISNQGRGLHAHAAAVTDAAGNDMSGLHWWEIDDEFISEMIIRHMVRAGWRHHAENLLCDIRWLRHRLLQSGIAKGLRDDYTVLTRTPSVGLGPGTSATRLLSGGSPVEDARSPRRSDSPPWDRSAESLHSSSVVANHFSLIKRAMISSSPALVFDVSQLAFQLTARLLSTAQREESSGAAPVKALLDSAREVEDARGASLLPEWQLFRPPSDPLLTIFDVRQSGVSVPSDETGSRFIVNSVVASPKSQLIAVAVHSGVAIFDYDSARVVDCWFFADGTRIVEDIAWVSGSQVFVACRDSNVYMFHVGALEAAGPTEPSVEMQDELFERDPLYVYGRHHLAVNTVAVNESKNEALTATGGDDCEVHVFLATSGDHVALLHGHEKPVVDCEWLAEKELLTASMDGTVRLWNVDTAVLLHKFEHGHPVRAIANCRRTGPSLFLSASDDGLVRKWSCDSTSGFANFAGRTSAEILFRTSHPVTGLVLLPNGTMVSASGQTVGRLDMRNIYSTDPSKRSWYIERAHEGEVAWLSLTMRTEGPRVLSCGDDGTVRMWDVTADVKSRARNVPHHAEFHPIDDSALLYLAKPTERIELVIVTVSEAGGICFLSEDTGNMLRELPMGSGSACVTFKNKPGVFVTGDSKGRCKIWEVPPGSPDDRACEPSSRERTVDHRGAVTCLAACPTSDVVASGSEQGELRLWRLDGTKNVLLSGSDADASCTALSWKSDGSAFFCGYEDGTTRMYTAEGTLVASARDSKYAGEQRVLSLAVSEPRGGQTFRLVTLSSDKKLRVWAATARDGVPSGLQLDALLYGHSDCASGSLVAIPKTTYVVSGSSDKTLRLWDVGGAGSDDVGDTQSAITRRLSPNRSEFYRNPVSSGARLGDSIVLADLMAEVRSLTLLSGSSGASHAYVAVGLSDGVLGKVRLTLPRSTVGKV